MSVLPDLCRATQWATTDPWRCGGLKARSQPETALRHGELLMQRLERDGLLASPRSALGSSMRWENYGAEEAKEEQVYVGRSLIGPPNPFTLMPTPSGPITHTQHPYVTGTSVLGLKYKDGVLIAADTAGSYGSTTRYKSVERLKAVSNNTLLGATGEISDFQALTQLLDRLIITDAMWDDGNKLGPLDIHNFLTRVMYNRRNKFDPLWNSLILGGVKNGQKYLGSVSMIGVHFVDEHIATGFGIHLAQPIFRSEWKEDMTLEEGKKLLEKALLVLFYRDRSAINKIQVANITEDSVQISRPYALKPTWNFKAFKNPTASAAGSW